MILSCVMPIAEMARVSEVGTLLEQAAKATLVDSVSRSFSMWLLNLTLMGFLIARWYREVSFLIVWPLFLRVQKALS